ncbi:MAG: helix-turn-helix transcriptional regulator [Candidatus Nanohaloarchaea archaeon]
MPKKFWSQKKVKHLERLVEEGKTSTEIADILGTTPDAVRQKMYREGIERNKEERSGLTDRSRTSPTG